MAFILEKKQSNNVVNTDNSDDEYYWTYSTTAIAIKWAVIGAIVLLILLWFVGGYFHAQRRIRAGKRPLAYHMFLVPRRQRIQFFPQPNPIYYNPHQGIYPPQEHPLQAYPPPPPAYNTEHYAPPQYQPPEGGSKVNPQQDYTVPPSDAPAGTFERGESSQIVAGTTTDVNHGGSRPFNPEAHGGLAP